MITQRAFASFRLDLANEQLWAGKAKVALRRKTFEVLRYLVDRPGQLVTKAALLDAVWAEVAVSDSMPSICVAELRKVLADDPRQPSIIETVHGRGYRFIAPVTQTTAVSPVRHPQSSALAPLVGREAEISELRRHLDQLRHGVGGFVLIGGVAGIGKTRLATELGIEATQAGMLTLVGNCYDRGDPVPFVPFVEILETALESAPSREAFREMLGADAAEISRLLPQLRRLFPDIPAPMELAPSQSQRMLLNAVGALLSRMATATPLFLLLEDLHWADQGTLSLINHLVRTVRKIPVLIVGTHRYGKPYAATLEELTRLRLAAQVSLHRLPQAAVAAMLSSLGGREPSPALVNLLHKTADGNPFWVGELFRHLAERGKLDNFDHTVRAELTQDLRDLPHSLRPIIGRRLARVSDATRDVLAASAVIGRSFSFALLRATTRIEPELLREHVEEAERAGLLTSTLEYPDTRFNFKHELIRQGVLSDLSALRRQRLHLQIAEAIEQLYPNTIEDWANDLAHHLWNAGAAAEIGKTIHYLQAAGQKAAQSSANTEALGHFRKALQLVATLPESPQRNAWELTLLIALGTPLIAASGFASPEVEKVYTRAHLLCGAAGQTPELFRVLMALQIFYMARGQYAAALALAERCLNLAETTKDSAHFMEAHRAVATVTSIMGQHARGLDHLERALALYDAAQHGSSAYLYGQDPEVGCGSLAVLALWFLGFPEKAARQRDEALAYARERSHPHSTAIALDFATWLAQLGGNIRETFERAESAVKFGSEHELAYWRTRALVLRGWARAKRGELDQGIEEMRLGIKTYTAIGVTHLRPFSLVLLAEVYADAGKVETGLELLAEARTIIEETGERFWEPEVHRLRGEMTLLLARVHPTEDELENEAQKCFRAALALAHDQGAKSLELRAATSLCRQLQVQGKRPKGGRRWLPSMIGSLRDSILPI
jgi:DNA-binding winged helix-turn-helix (wHTH) protein/predicted ATPase